MSPRTLSILASVLFFTVSSSAQAFTPAHFWSQRFGSPNTDSGQSVAVDASGNVAVIGHFEGTIDLGGGALTGAGNWDIFLARYNAAGVHQWSKGFGGTGLDLGNSVTVDASGNVFITGYFAGTVSFGGGNLTSAGGNDMFLAKYNAAGVHQWSKRFGGTGNDSGISIAVDASGQFFVTGYFNDTVDFGGGNLTSAGAQDIFVAKFNSAGVHQWSQRFGATGNEIGRGIAVDASGSAIVTGYFQVTVDFGGGSLTSAGGSDIFVAKYSATGVHQWSRRFGDTGTDTGYSVAVDGSGNATVTGYFNGTVDLGGGNLTSAGGNDIFLAQYNPTGVHRWSHRFGSPQGDSGNNTAVDAFGNVFLVGYFQGTVDFGGGNLTTAGAQDIFIACYSAAGVHRWSQRFGDSGSDSGESGAFNASGHVFVTGSFAGTVNFGGGNLSTGGGIDVFVAKFAGDPAEPGITSIADIGNDQGRQLLIEFVRSGYDDPGSPSGIVQYEAYRRIDPAPPVLADLKDNELYAVGWTQVGAVMAHGERGYSVVVPTIGDSTAAHGAYYSTYFIRSATSSPYTFFDSPIDSGYSIDNLAPGTPVDLAYFEGDLTWNESSDEDFDYFTVYGSDTPSFATAIVVTYSTTPAVDVGSAPYVFYFVTATDFSGNEGKPAMLNTLTGANGAPKSYVLSISAYPNPFNPTTTIRYTVPSRGPVTIAVYDARGALVTTLVENEDRTAGAHTAGWDGRARSGATVSSGIYFARIDHQGATRSKKMVLLK